jgi:hypothetical protein
MAARLALARRHSHARHGNPIFSAQHRQLIAEMRERLFGILAETGAP